MLGWIVGAIVGSMILDSIEDSYTDEKCRFCNGNMKRGHYANGGTYYECKDCGAHFGGGIYKGKDGRWHSHR